MTLMTHTVTLQLPWWYDVVATSRVWAHIWLFCVQTRPVHTGAASSLEATRRVQLFSEWPRKNYSRLEKEECLPPEISSQPKPEISRWCTSLLGCCQWWWNCCISSLYLYGWVSSLCKLPKRDMTSSFFSFRIGEACSHVAALLFKVEYAVQNGYTAVTSQTCSWNQTFCKHVSIVWHVIDR